MGEEERQLSVVVHDLRTRIVELEGRMRDARIHVDRARADAGEPDAAIPPHRATKIRQNLRFAKDLLAP